MSLLSRLFGGGASSVKTMSSADAIQRLREVEEMLGKKQEFLERKVDNEIEIAKKNGTKNKRVALAALKRKKRYEQQLKQIDGTLTTIEYQRGALEDANSNTTVLKAMGDAAKALKRSHADMDVDKVHDLMDDIQEQQDLSKEISELISNPAAFGAEVDEDELLQELEELENEQVRDKLLEVPSSDSVPENLPSVPSERLAAAKKKNEDESELAGLAEWAA
ncbi:LOW QUALITY PROTEIN: charged multivesicular body protein 4c [Galendromus occidentalis]|uniref:LOW QUALITY PROTEIN: charged multivesicular body protein 4c n=1 Tax=Galendromus occidentalis TaxID=34638 RepID=A0AAJ7PAA3_9ACAR|nr:LOW QUALITY PROTEIN: charged multivesicular body protein 4c [Galendromus occidentalis]